MPSRILALPFIILLAIYLYLSWKIASVSNSASYIIISSMVALSVIYAMSPQIDWWWYKKHPPQLDKPIRQLLLKFHPFYNSLSVEDKKKFRQRIALYVIAVDFIPKGWESIPEDVKYAIAASIITLTFQKEDFLLYPFERIVVYPTPFPSPQYPKKFHSSELFKEDGVLLFSAQQVMLHFLQPNQYYNIVLHEYIKAYNIVYPNADILQLQEDDWTQLEKVSTITKNHIEAIINLPDIDPSIVAVNLYITFPKSFKKNHPDLAKKIGATLGTLNANHSSNLDWFA